MFVMTGVQSGRHDDGKQAEKKHLFHFKNLLSRLVPWCCDAKQYNAITLIYQLPGDIKNAFLLDLFLRRHYIELHPGTDPFIGISIDMFLRPEKSSLSLKRFLFSGSLRLPVLTAAAVAGTSAVGSGLLPPAWILILLTAPFFLRRKERIIYLTAAAAALLSLWIHGELALFRGREPGLPVRSRATLVLHINDGRLTSVPGILPPALIKAEILKCTPESSTPPRRYCFFRLPQEGKVPLHGSIIKADATLTHPGTICRLHRPNRTGTTVQETETGFKRYLAARGADTIALIDSGFETISHRRSLLSLPLHIRDCLLARTISGISSDNNRQLCAALFFGVSGGMTPEFRRNFAASGTIHLFAVSGLHVGMLAALAAALLLPLPFKLRHVLITAVVWCYVFVTGANPPVFRAGLMTGAFCLLRGFLFQIPLTDLLGYAASILLLMEPALVGDTGFQYSFIITGALLLHTANHREMMLRMRAEEVLIPEFSSRRIFRRASRHTGKIAGAAAVTATAFLAGAGISMLNQDLFIPGAIFANMLITPLLPLFFIVLFFKLTAGSLSGWCNKIAAEVLDFLFNVISSLAEIFAELCGNIPVCRPSAAEVIFYTAGVVLFLILLWRKPRIALCSGAVSISILLSLILRVQLSPPAVLAVSGDSGTPVSIAVISPASGEAVVINMPDYSGTSLLADALAGHGIRKIDRIAFDAPFSDRTHGLAAAADKLELKTIQLPPAQSRRNRRFWENIEKYTRREDAESIGSGNRGIKIISSSGRDHRQLAAEIKIPGVPVLTVSSRDLDSGRKITVAGNNTRTIEYLLPWSLEKNLLELPLP